MKKSNRSWGHVKKYNKNLGNAKNRKKQKNEIFVWRSSYLYTTKRRFFFHYLVHKDENYQENIKFTTNETFFFPVYVWGNYAWFATHFRLSIKLPSLGVCKNGEKEDLNRFINFSRGVPN
jgi:hypothetical protein